MSVIKLHLGPDETPEEEAALVARVAATLTEQGEEDVHVEVVRPEQVSVSGSVSDRMSRGARWGD